jgi:hypothetical protein
MQKGLSKAQTFFVFMPSVKSFAFVSEDIKTKKHEA